MPVLSGLAGEYRLFLIFHRNRGIVRLIIAEFLFRRAYLIPLENKAVDKGGSKVGEEF